ncbi:MAG: 23S rRNA (adenine(2503)-C(2))-methyltransferase [Thermodesulfovibrio sp. RBG_19FT_COMBO_42_12]|nr:MAG: 23S rRNA (adenine(2503)-C(2))-methyltransferase [Thermodesulfovibrio sp. RBG_19FT_COMBO_42_12]HZX47729.1 23S rRNA (adenine(2503)-C(2))-methyltransferase RlmN [Nitrospirota bacterium]
MKKADLRDLDLAELEDFALALGLQRYRGRQLFHWVYGKGVDSLDMMTDLSKESRELLSEKTYISSLQEERRQYSSDGTEKFLFELEDGHRVESVLIPEEDRLTLCISTQVGCGMGCTFCLTGKGGLARNLKSSEIVNQVLLVQKGLPEGRGVTNIVIMGMGEPLSNFNNVIKAIEILKHPLGPAIGARRITLSTAGLVTGIKKLGESNLNINLAISLNASTDDQRSQIMPVNSKYPLKKLIGACREFPLRKGRVLSFEYVLLEGVNDSPEDARRVSTLLKGIPCKINLIPFNEFPGAPYKSPSEKAVLRFQEILTNNNYSVFIRKPRGRDILAACGQLREEE